MDIIDLYVKNLKKEDILLFAQKNDINLSDNELDFTYDFIKNNYREAIQNKDTFDLSAYRNRFSSENYEKIENLLLKYISYL